jgi:hypothetical protein
MVAPALQIPVGSENEILSFLHDLADWVRASHGNDGHQFIVRPFKPTMSLRTVTKLSAEWHEAVASNLSGPQHIFPAPWLPPATVNGLDIIPIDNSASLYREGASMHHCVGTYAEEVRAGRYQHADHPQAQLVLCSRRLRVFQHARVGNAKSRHGKCPEPGKIRKMKRAAPLSAASSLPSTLRPIQVFELDCTGSSPLGNTFGSSTPLPSAT